jgi:hypothetical protein
MECGDWAVVECGTQLISLTDELIIASRITPSDAGVAQHPKPHPAHLCIHMPIFAPDKDAREDIVTSTEISSPIFLQAKHGMAATRKRKEQPGVPRRGITPIWLIRCKCVIG